MKYERFEDLPVWGVAVDLADGVYALTRHRVFAQPGDLSDQLRRAALSVSNNIAEGFEQGTTAGLLAYLYIARGSAGEVRSMLHFCERLFCKDDDCRSNAADRPVAPAERPVASPNARSPPRIARSPPRIARSPSRIAPPPI